MSRLFEALQRSNAGRFGAPLSALPTMAAGVVEAKETPGNDFEQLSPVPVTISPSAQLVTLASPESLGAEKFRLLAVRITHLQKTRNFKRLLITSTMAEEGKSLVAANLSVALARRTHRKVLLLEGDLRRPSQAQMFGLATLPGLSEWLQSETSDPATVYHMKEAGMWLIPAGIPPENPTELMQSKKLPALLDQMNNWFDWVVIDSPPVLPIADTSLWMRLTEGILLVAREGKTERRQLKRGLEGIGTASLVGVVINDCTTTSTSNYYQRYCLPAHRPNGDAQVRKATQ